MQTDFQLHLFLGTGPVIITSPTTQCSNYAAYSAHHALLFVVVVCSTTLRNTPCTPDTTVTNELKSNKTILHVELQLCNSVPFQQDVTKWSLQLMWLCQHTLPGGVCSNDSPHAIGHDGWGTNHTYKHTYPLFIKIIPFLSIPFHGFIITEIGQSF